jgi:hypothetical protein
MKTLSMIAALLLVGCESQTPHRDDAFARQEEAMRLRASQWHTCIQREFARAVPAFNGDRAISAEIAFGVCRTEEEALIGSSVARPAVTMAALAQAKANLKQQMITGR